VSGRRQELAEAGRQVFVEKEPQALVRSGSSRSMTALSCVAQSLTNVVELQMGCSFEDLLKVIPSATIATTARRGTEDHGCKAPPIRSGSVVIRSNLTPMTLPAGLAPRSSRRGTPARG